MNRRLLWLSAVTANLVALTFSTYMSLDGPLEVRWVFMLWTASSLILVGVQVSIYSWARRRQQRILREYR